MKKARVVIEETCVEEFEITLEDGESDEDAVIRKAIDAYEKGDLVLTPGEVQHRQLAVIVPQKGELQWVAF